MRVDAMFDKTALLKSEHPQPESKVLTARVYPEYSTTLEIPGKYIHTVQTLKLLERAALGRSGKPLVFALFNNVFSLSLSLSFSPLSPSSFLGRVLGRHALFLRPLAFFQVQEFPTAQLRATDEQSGGISAGNEWDREREREREIV